VISYELFRIATSIYCGGFELFCIYILNLIISVDKLFIREICKSKYELQNYIFVSDVH